jgi:hypothetical protein
MLDEFVNDGDPGLVTTFLTSLQSAPDPNEGDFGPFAGNDDVAQHWGEHWSNADGFGGTYWPYLDALSVHSTMARMLASSIEIARDQRKPHTTVWLPIRDAPPAGTSLELEDQQRLFTAWVHVAPHSVQLVIVTPVPQP